MTNNKTNIESQATCNSHYLLEVCANHTSRSISWGQICMRNRKKNVMNSWLNEGFVQSCNKKDRKPKGGLVDRT